MPAKKIVKIPMYNMYKNKQNMNKYKKQLARSVEEW